MASPCRIRIAGSAAGTAAAQRALAAAQAEVVRIEQHFSRYRAESIVSRINAASGAAYAVALDAETAGLLQFADALHRDSGGLFDITSGVLRRVWDFKAARLPDRQALHAALALVGWSQVEFDGRSIRLPQPGMELDFGGFGKEYAADRAASLLSDAGLKHGYVNLGGDIRLLGPTPSGAPWRLGIAHPREAAAVIGGVELDSGALATSGDYERYFELEGQRYCHILDPRSGWPVQHWQSVSVLAPACLAAGALTTIAMLKGPEAGAFLQSQGVAWIGVDALGGVCSQGLARHAEETTAAAADESAAELAARSRTRSEVVFRAQHRG
jgi:thiamine biosynthesis lipoprotein